MRFADTSRGRPFAKDPAVVWFRGRYMMYYSLPPYRDGRAADGWAIGVAESADLTSWRRIGEIAPAHEYERRGLCAPGALVRGDELHLFYQTYGNGRDDSLCHAVSADGLEFRRNPTNPVFRAAGSWNCGRAIDADVLLVGDRALLAFATRDPAMEVQMVGVASAPADSPFGRGDWAQLGDGPALRPELPWEQTCIEAPALYRRDGRLFMFYAGAYNNRPQQVGCAWSADGLRWERLSAEPLLPCGAPGSWNASESGHPFLFADRDGRTYLFFQGNDDGGATWHLSHVEVLWEAGRPVLAGPA